MRDLLKEFVDKVCPTCKSECRRGITFVQDEVRSVRCLDYIKDESKIKKLEKELYSTANKEKPVMRDIV